ncbi:MAG: hypothetical protein R3E60_07165 [Alphaproteobacteria bacterium]
MVIFLLSHSSAISAEPLSQYQNYDEAYTFISEKVNEGDQWHRYRSTLIPLVPDRICFGWAMHLADPSKLVTVRETLSVEARPQEWRHEHETRVAADGKSAVTEFNATPIGGWIGHQWCILEGDPAGYYIFDIEIDRRPAKKLRMCAEPPDQQTCTRYTS